ncbi:hypothetical protein [Parafrankia colletiae]|uniref:hypothetical protein n=1 Tax=Parafrankia colletiae TaxID=573497 RepID=UPI0018E34D7E|nr:hypothetical protein [Parafrankia colletiae]
MLVGAGLDDDRGAFGDGVEVGGGGCDRFAGDLIGQLGVAVAENKSRANRGVFG